MEHLLRRIVLGALGFAFVLVWATLGATDAVLALVACLAGANIHRLGLAPRRRVMRERRPAITARPLRDEGDERHPLVPEDPSLIITTSS
jgi:hypothetical protein